MSLSVISEQIQDQAQGVVEESSQSRRLRSLMTTCFHIDDLISFEQEFKELKNLVQKILESGDVKSFDEVFFIKFSHLSQLRNPLKCKRVIEIFIFTLQNPSVQQHLCSLASKQRFLVDLINSFFNMMEKFQYTYLEWNLKVLFYEINEVLSQHEIFTQIVHMVTHSGGKILEQPQISTLQDQQIRKMAELSRSGDLKKKDECITLITLVLGKCKVIEEQYYILTTLLPPILTDLLALSEDMSEQSRVNLLGSLIDVVERYIFATEFNVELETISIQGIRSYTLKNELSYLQKHPQIYFPVASILNEILILPHQIALQTRAFSIIRRMFYVFPSIRELLEDPLLVSLSNIAIFSKNVQQEKEATIFLYKVLQNPEVSPDFLEKLNQNQYIQKLKENKFYSVKALSYPNDDDFVIRFKTFSLQVLFPLVQEIDAGSFFVYNVCIQKSNTIIYWNFKTIDFDIHFGLYRIESLEDFQIDDFKSENKCRAIIKLQKSDSNKESISGFSLINMPGYYKLVFDNSYSYFRKKELYYSVHVLEAK